MSSYFLSKYVKSVIFNLLLITIWAFIKLCFRFEISGASAILIIWIFVNPFFVFAVSNFVILFLGKRY